MDKPKVVYRYTHAEALEGGELRLAYSLIPLRPPVYIGYQLDALLKKESICDEVLINAIHATLAPLKRKGSRVTCVLLPILFDIVISEEIRNDDQRVVIITCVLEGES